MNRRGCVALCLVLAACAGTPSEPVTAPPSRTVAPEPVPSIDVASLTGTQVLAMTDCRQLAAVEIARQDAWNALPSDSGPDKTFPLLTIQQAVQDRERELGC